MLRVEADTEVGESYLIVALLKARQHLPSVPLVGLVLFLLMRQLSLMFWSYLSTFGIKTCDSSNIADVTTFLLQNGLMLEFRWGLGIYGLTHMRSRDHLNRRLPASYCRE